MSKVNVWKKVCLFRYIHLFRRLVYRRIMPEAERLPENEQLAEKRSFAGNCEILTTIFQPKALSSKTKASRKGVTLRLISERSAYPL